MADEMAHTEDSVVVCDMSVYATLKITLTHTAWQSLFSVLLQMVAITYSRCRSALA